jgi:hypothetical protein
MLHRCRHWELEGLYRWVPVIYCLPTPHCTLGPLAGVKPHVDTSKSHLWPLRCHLLFQKGVSPQVNLLQYPETPRWHKSLLFRPEADFDPTLGIWRNTGPASGPRYGASAPFPLAQADASNLNSDVVRSKERMVMMRE